MASILPGGRAIALQVEWQGGEVLVRAGLERLAAQLVRAQAHLRCTGAGDDLRADGRVAPHVQHFLRRAKQMEIVEVVSVALVVMVVMVPVVVVSFTQNEVIVPDRAPTDHRTRRRRRCYSVLQKVETGIQPLAAEGTWAGGTTIVVSTT